MLDQAQLSQFTGTMQYTKLPVLLRWKPTAYTTYEFPVATDGAMYVLEKGGENGAFWLWDVISSHIQTKASIREERLLVCELKVDAEENSATFTMTDGNYNELAKQDIPYTDFDAEGITLWFSSGVLMLPSEY